MTLCQWLRLSNTLFLSSYHPAAPLAIVKPTLDANPIIVILVPFLPIYTQQCQRYRCAISHPFRCYLLEDLRDAMRSAS